MPSERKEAADLRTQMLAQLNSVLRTVDTPRGLVSRAVGAVQSNCTGSVLFNLLIYGGSETTETGDVD